MYLTDAVENLDNLKNRKQMKQKKFIFTLQFCFIFT